MVGSNLLFVYGTLRSSFAGVRMARYLRREADLLGAGRIAGRLYGLRRYPGLRPPLELGEWVQGELYRIRRPGLVLPALDAYESSQYRRILRLVWREGVPEPVRAWTYLFAHPLARHRRVNSGNWPDSPLPHLLRRQSPSC